ncbi:MAG: glycoside hydrolase family 9 protein [Gemmatimonadaceae bacterium]
MTARERRGRMRELTRFIRGAVALALLSAVSTGARGQGLATGHDAIRVNQVGYLPDAPKVAVLCALSPRQVTSFQVVDASGRIVLTSRSVTDAGAFGPCIKTYRLAFTAVRRTGTYRDRAGDLESGPARIGPDVWKGLADVPLVYMRQQRSGWNPAFAATVHPNDGILVDHATRTGEVIHASGGWADASDYLQYVTTSATATYQLLQAWRDQPWAFGDTHQADGRPGANGLADVADEARHGLAWLLRMFPDDSLMLNQIGDDRDHAFHDLPTTDSSDYGWGKGRERPLYPCTGQPQGLLKHKNRASGSASTAGKLAASFALGAQLFASREPAFADTLTRKARAAFAVGERSPGACQTAPAGSPYFYEEDDWADDMELGAAALFALTGETRFRTLAREYAAREPVKPWMGADTASHYQWYPFHNIGHFELARRERGSGRARIAGYYREGLERVARRATNGFGVGIPFIWCSNDLMTSLAVQAILYRRLTRDARFRELEQSAIDWLFGTNPWGVSMVIGIPRDGRFPLDPHSDVARFMKWELTGGLVDGPVYRSIFTNLLGIHLTRPDELAPWNTGHIVYHDNYGDYSTNEPIMDGSVNVLFLLSTLAPVNR